MLSNLYTNNKIHHRCVAHLAWDSRRLCLRLTYPYVTTCIPYSLPFPYQVSLSRSILRLIPSFNTISRYYLSIPPLDTTSPYYPSQNNNFTVSLSCCMSLILSLPLWSIIEKIPNPLPIMNRHYLYLAFRVRLAYLLFPISPSFQKLNVFSLTSLPIDVFTSPATYPKKSFQETLFANPAP